MSSNVSEVKNEIKIDLAKANVQDSVSIVIVHKDKPEYLNIALQSIAVNSINNNYEIVVVDNASGADTQTFLDDLEKDVKVVRSDKNLYFSAAANLGFRHADKNSKYIITAVGVTIAATNLLKRKTETSRAG